MLQKSPVHTASCHAPALACEKLGCFAVHFCTARFSPAQIAMRPRWVALLRSYSSALHLRRAHPSPLQFSFFLIVVETGTEAVHAAVHCHYGLRGSSG